MHESGRRRAASNATECARCSVRQTSPECNFRSIVTESTTGGADVSALRSTNSTGCLGSNACNWSQGLRGAPNFLNRGPNYGIPQVYTIVLATIFIINSSCDSRALAAAPLPSARPHFLQSAASQLQNPKHFAKFGAGVNVTGKEQQQERLVVKHDRFDPLHHLKRYKGGYDLKSKHYWASTLFAGIHGYFLGALWFLGGIFGVIAFYIRYHHVGKKASHMQFFCKLPMISIDERRNKPVPTILATTCIALIICSCGVACVGSQRFHLMAKKVETTLIVQGADNATRLIRIVTQMMGQMKVDIEPYDQGVAQKLDNTTFKLNNASISLVNVVHDHKSSLNAILLGLNVGVITLAMLNITLWATGFVCLLFFPKLVWAFFTVFALMWLIVSLNWVTFGITFSLSNFADDTCEALKEYLESSRNTTLDNVLPCHDLAIGKKMVFRFREKIYNYIEEANKYISKRNKKQLTAESDNMEPTPHVCNPFLGPPYYSPSNSCKEGTISISTLPQLLTLFKCPSSSKTKETSFGCISTRQYNIASAYISATQKLLSLLPDIEDLTGCTFLVDTFTIILQKECKPLKHSIRMVWIAMMIISTLTTIVMIILLLNLYFIKRLDLSSPKQGGAIKLHDQSHLPP